MHAALAWAVTVETGAHWLRALAALSAAAVASTLAWAFQHGNAVAGWVPLATALFAGMLCRRAGQREAWILRWDGERWSLASARAAPAGSQDHGSLLGRLQVAMDLGPWLLLRFDAESAAGASRRRVWLPLQQGGARGLGTADWHRLRCTVYQARATAAPAAPPADRGA